MDAVRPWLYIGRYRETQDYDLLVRAGISAMLQLAEQVRQPGIETLYLAVRDGETLAPATLRRGLDFVLLRPVSYTHLRAHETVLDLVCRLLLEKKKTYTRSSRY